MTYQTLIAERHESTLTITLNRPDVRNAFNAELIADLITVLKISRNDNDLRCLIIKGAGKAFCAGADLNYMKAMKDQDYASNCADAQRLAACFHLLYTFPVPTICRLHGAAIGGGVGLVSACDFVFAEPTAVLSLSEVKIGLVPAVISPFVIRRIGVSRAKQFFITGERISAELAATIGLVDRLAAIEKLDQAIATFASDLKKNGPQAVRTAKELAYQVSLRPYDIDLLDYTAELIAAMRTSAEGQEGISSFLDKREPNWG